MTTTRSLARKTITSLLALSILTGGVFAPFSQTRIARAQIPVTDVANLTVNTVSAANETTQTVINQILNGLAWSVAKLTVQSITRSVVNWINSGFQGSPAFVSDLRQNLAYLGDAIAEDFMDQLDLETERLTGFNIRTPFQDQINQKLREEYYRTTASWGLDYTLDQVSDDPRAFIDEGRFERGGFNAFFSASQNPSNNPFGAYKRATDQLWAQIDSAAQQRKAELGWGRGFLPWRGPCANGGAGGPVPLTRAEGCPFNQVRTPGSVIEDQLAHSLGSGVRQLELADSINEIVGALLGQLVNQVLGAGGLLGTSQPAAGGGPSYIDRAANPNQLAAVGGSLAQGVEQNIARDRRSIQEYIDNWTQIRDVAQTAQDRCGPVAPVPGTIARADGAMVRGRQALLELEQVAGRVISASAVQDANQTAAILSAVTEYQSFLTSSAVPSAEEIAEARNERRDDSQNEEAAGLPSLYTQMVEVQSTCRSSR